MSAIGKGLIHPLTALKMRKEGLTDIVWPESLANSEAHSDLLFWCLDVWYWIHDIIVNGWYSTILIGDFFILFGRMCRGFRNKFLNFRGEDGGSTCLRWPGGKLWNMEGSMSFRPQHGVKRGFFSWISRKRTALMGGWSWVLVGWHQHHTWPVPSLFKVQDL